MQTLWVKAEAVYATVVDNPGKTVIAVGLVAVGVMVFLRHHRRRL